MISHNKNYFGTAIGRLTLSRPSCHVISVDIGTEPAREESCDVTLI